MELVVVAALGYVIWRATNRRSSPPPTGRRVQPRSSGQAAGSSYTYAFFNTEGREGWPTSVLKAVEGLFEVANAEEPATLGKMRTIAKRLTKLGTIVVDHLEPIVESLHEQRGDLDTPDPVVDALQALLDTAYDLTSAEEEAESAEEEIDVDVIGYAQSFVDAWQEAPSIGGLTT